MTLSDIRKRLEGATPGPWVVGNPHRSGAAQYVRERDIDAEVCVVYNAQFSNAVRTLRDADFIAHAPSDISFLLAHIDTLERALGEAKEWLAHGRHTPMCTVYRPEPEHCSCGLSDLRALIDHALSETRKGRE